jgi:hypothetical protein
MKALGSNTRKWLDGLASGLDLTKADDRGILRERVAYATRATSLETVNGRLGKKFPDRDAAVRALVSRYLEDEVFASDKLSGVSAL